MIVFSSHAKEAMRQSGISEEEVTVCREHGRLVIKQLVKGELRYGKELELKDKKIIVIYVFEKEDTKVITCYPIKRKKWK